ncbi:ATP-dependent RNA helicase DDX24 [Cryptosporidium felis]|nr:ATP-dependent RNA helicase DDX24 [Cryptosporidium felis]
MVSTNKRSKNRLDKLKWKEVELDNGLLSEFSKYGMSMIEEISDTKNISFYELGKHNQSHQDVSTFFCEQNNNKKDSNSRKRTLEVTENYNTIEKKLNNKKAKSKSEREKISEKPKLVDGIKESILDPEKYWEDYFELKERLSNWTKIMEESSIKPVKKYFENEMEELKSPDMVIHPSILKGLYELGFLSPTPIQKACLIPSIRDRKDIVGAAETGSGKTLAYGIPIVANILLSIQKRREKFEQKSQDEFHDQEPLDNLDEDEILKEFESMGFEMRKVSNTYTAQNSTRRPYESSESVQAMIVLPSRELAIQVRDHLRAMARYTGLGIHAFVGGLSLEKQERLIATKKVQISIGTPGRLSALILGELDENKTEKQINVALPLDELRYLVMDEADRLIEQGHYRELKSILQLIYSEKKGERTKKIQTYLFSATLTLPNHLHPKFSKINPVNTSKRAKLRTDLDSKITSIMPENSNKAMQSIMQYVKLRENQVFVVDLSRFKIKSNNEDEFSDKGSTQSGIIQLPKGLKMYMVKCESDEVEMRLVLYLLRYFAPKWEIKQTKGSCPHCPKFIETGKILIFVNSISYVYRLVPLLQLALVCRDSHEKELLGAKKTKKCNQNCLDKSLKVIGIHGNLSQKQRIQAIELFKSSSSSILICTDVLARGLDIPEVDVVVHLQAPRSASLMIHRSGRTARALKEGECVLFCTPKDVTPYSKHLKAISLGFDAIKVPNHLENVTSVHISQVKQRLELANEIEGLGHSILRKKKNNKWMISKANEADLELSDQEEFELSPDQIKDIQSLVSKRNILLKIAKSNQSY